MGNELFKERIFRDALPLAQELLPYRERKLIVLANGCFDILHVGHVRYLREAASLGEILVVAVNDDKSTRVLKGEGRPIVREDERAELVMSLRFVDYVLIFDEETVDGIIEILRPHIHAKGTDYTVDTVPERKTARSVGCRTVIVGDPKDHASRDIIERIRRENGCGP